MLTTTDGDHNVTQDTYNAAGEVVSETTAAGTADAATTTEEYDADGNVAKRTDAAGTYTLFTYDGAGRVLTETTYDRNNSQVGFTATTYDADGNVLSKTDGDHNVTRYTYDGAGRVLTEQKFDQYGALVGSMTYTYDQDGNVLTTTVTADTYNAAGELVSQTIGFGTSAAATTQYQFDLAGNRTQVIDPAGNVTQDTFDGAGRVLTETVHDAHGTLVRSRSTAYDQDGHVTQTTAADGRTVGYAYDGAGRVTTETWYAAGGSVTDTRSYSYDADGKVLTASNKAGTYTFTYDGEGRVQTQSDPNGLTLTFGYDSDGNLTSVADSQGGLVTSRYDGGLLTSRQYSNGTTQLRIDLTYDENGNILTETRYSDLAATHKVGFTQFTYDGDGTLSHIQHQDGSGNVLADYAYGYDQDGRLTSQTDNGTTTGYGYDAQGQLTSAGSQMFSYDAAGNRTSAGAVTGPDNQLTSDGTWNYAYDAAGNQVGKTSIATGETWSFTYDVAGHQTSAVHKDGSGNVLLSATYTFDVFGNRFSASVTTLSGTTVTKFSYDDAQGGQGNVYADVDGGGNLAFRRVFLDGTDQVAARVSAGGAVSWYLTDHLGSVRAVTDANSAVQDEITYDAFGNITSESNAVYGDRYKYTGREFDAETGLYYYRARMYDAATARFDGVDPAQADQNNEYRYVGNGPTGATDPSGQYLVVPSGAQDAWQNELSHMGFSSVAQGLPGGRVGIVVQEAQHIREMLAGTSTGESGNWQRNVLRAFLNIGGTYNLEGYGDLSISETGFKPGELDELRRMQFRLWDGGKYREEQQQPSLTKEFFTGLGHGGIIVGNRFTQAFTLGQWKPLEAKAEQLIEENGGAYKWADASARVGAEAAFMLVSGPALKAAGTLAGASGRAAGAAAQLAGKIPGAAEAGAVVVKGVQAIPGVAYVPFLGRTALVSFKYLGNPKVLLGLQAGMVLKNIYEGVKLCEQGEYEQAAGAFGAAGVDAIALVDTLKKMAEAAKALGPAPTNTLAQELQAYRQTLPPRTATSGGTAGVARTDLPGLEARTFRGASPNAGGPVEAGGTIRSPNPSPRFQLHAEEDLANQIDRAIQGARLTSEQMVGRTLNMHIEQRVCNICRQGLRGTEVPPGVLKQLSDRYPNITFNVTAEGTNEVLRFRGGRFVD